ncbi:MAG: hypothetical protein EOO52_13050 [Gammaproteobacteria bacterium]|nr:MAG: hypothetical protein EOO52_13050 [Gammaproteobacteria bacterium]
MTIEPKPLRPGWFKRAAVNSIRLSKRKPILWFLIYFCLPVLTYFLPYMNIAVFAAACMVVFGTFLAFNADEKNTWRFEDFLLILWRRPSLITVSLFCIIFPGGSSGLLQLSFTSPLQTFFVFGVNAMVALCVAFVFAPFIIMLFIDFPTLFLKRFKTRKLSKADSEEYFRDYVPLGEIRIFSLHLSVDTNLKWNEISHLSDQGKRNITGREQLILAVLLLLSMLSPIVLGLVIPFFYCVYKELFFQKGICEKREARKTSAVHACQ